jgi:hypothetical protein
MTAASEGGIYSRYAQSNTGLHWREQACVTNFITIVDNPGDWALRRDFPQYPPVHGSTQRPSALIRLINSSTPCASGTFLISSLPRYKEM